MYHARFSIEAESGAATEVASAQLVESLAELDEITVRTGSAASVGDWQPRVTGLEVFATFLTSAAAYQLARAVRDFVNRQNVRLHVRSSDGRQITISAKGADLSSIADLVGFLTGQHGKSSLQVSTPETPADLIGKGEEES